MSEKQSIPIQAVDADQLPREHGISYDEVAYIIGSLYLDSHHRVKVLEEQFSAVSEEYKQQLSYSQASESELKKQVISLRRELEILTTGRETGGTPSNTTSSNHGGDDCLSDNS
jgi:hypothetical protein